MPFAGVCLNTFYFNGVHTERSPHETGRGVSFVPDIHFAWKDLSMRLNSSSCFQCSHENLLFWLYDIVPSFEEPSSELSIWMFRAQEPLGELRTLVSSLISHYVNDPAERQ